MAHDDEEDEPDIELKAPKRISNKNQNNHIASVATPSPPQQPQIVTHHYEEDGGKGEANSNDYNK